MVQSLALSSPAVWYPSSSMCAKTHASVSAGIYDDDDDDDIDDFIACCSSGACAWETARAGKHASNTVNNEAILLDRRFRLIVWKNRKE